MQQIQQQINLFHNLYFVCLGICIFCLALSIFFFFKFNIRNIFNTRTGRSVKKTVQKVEEMNARTGQLRRPVNRGNTGNLGRSGSLGKKRAVRKANMDEIIQPPPSAGATEPLDAGMATDVLDAGATGVLSPEEQSIMTAARAQEEVDESFGMFRIDKYMIFIHTDEVV